jgi:hypothetical protein
MSRLKEIYLLAAKDNLSLDPLNKSLFAAQKYLSRGENTRKSEILISKP